ncbi:hypothetical protein PUV54_14560 [Hyphococcus flavus]|uniref:SLH domain-containing protein n=1 Tax=Hyphococcus flavus TaxID=1866326 RepID=A0AAE9ZIU6_9PROT|nr:hypothetical protein [Hyphococcus flavus]WDI31170.1 hypothetical protein PUV54_14560 [Hyphococcus flavus]
MRFGLFAVVACSFVLTASCLADVPETAEANSTWSATYRGAAQQLGGLWIGDARTEFAEQSGLSAEDAGLALRYLLSYPVDVLTVEHVLIRYPHYNPTAIKADFDRLTTLGFLARNNQNWTITPEGVSLISHWYEAAEKSASVHEEKASHIDDHLLYVLDKIVSSASALEDQGINQSINWRLNHRFRAGDESPLLVKIDERVWDYIAFINDNAHYRVDRYDRANPDIIPDRIMDDPLAKELFAAMRSDREYPLTRCTEHRIWRNGEQTCAASLSRLEAVGWIEEDTEGVFKQTQKGAELFNEIEALTDARLYSTWSEVSVEEYERYMEILESIPNLIEN